MTLVEFLYQWEKDDFKFRQLGNKKTNEAEWFLYQVTLPYSSMAHGRHTALMLAINPETREVLAHNFKNVHTENESLWGKEIYGWWDEHVAEGLVYA